MDAVVIPLTRGYFAKIDEIDYADVSQWNWWANVDPRCDKVYATTEFTHLGKKITMSLHRFLIDPPPDMIVDHADDDGLNNRRANLRLATLSQNAGNSRKLAASSSIFKGVYAPKGMKCRAKIAGKYLGTFDTELEAAITYDAAAIALYGPFAKTNAMLGLV